MSDFYTEIQDQIDDEIYEQENNMDIANIKNAMKNTKLADFIGFKPGAEKLGLCLLEQELEIGLRFYEGPIDNRFKKCDLLLRGNTQYHYPYIGVVYVNAGYRKVRGGLEFLIDSCRTIFIPTKDKACFKIF